LYSFDFIGLLLKPFEFYRLPAQRGQLRGEMIIKRILPSKYSAAVKSGSPGERIQCAILWQLISNGLLQQSLRLLCICDACKWSDSAPHRLKH